jgi:phosphoglucosamine mutase
VSGVSESPHPGFGTDGVRGIAIVEVSPEFVMALGRAVARVLRPSRLVLGRDPRLSGPVLEAAFSAGASAEGVRVEEFGVLPTPALAMIAARESVPAVVVTASHNKYSDNGVKVFAAGGRKLSDAQERAIEAETWRILDEGTGPIPRNLEVGVVMRRSDGVTMYVDHLVDIFGEGSLAGLRVVVDTANGAMSAVAPVLLQRLGADVIVMNDAPDGTNINDKCGATAPQALCDFISGTGTGISVDMGFAFDGDGDRLIAVDENGRVVDGDRSIALSAIDRREAGTLAGDSVVVTVMSNLGFHRAMSNAGISVITTGVGDRLVLDAMESGGYVLGGEQSGHIIHRDLATTGDGLLAAVVLARMMRRHGGRFSQVAAGVMHSLPQVLKNVRVAVRPDDVASLLAAEIAAESATLGVNGRVLVRSSGTEPVVRVMVEAGTLDLAELVADRLAAAALEKCR